ncbi:MAG: response regulator, partial [Pseudanabaena sp. CAN_BIN31]|nr:response regulator [Pseudanabaena sp. CAN_BIN31]
SYEYRFQHQNGHYLWIRSELRVIRNSQNIPIEIVGYFADISDRKQAEAQLQTVNEQLRQSNDQLAQSVSILERSNALSTVMQEASFDGILVIDEHRRVFTYNQKFVRQWHIPQEIVTEGNDRQLLATALSQLTNPNEFLELVEHLYENPKKISRDEISFIDGRTFDRCSAPIYWDSKYYGRIWFYRDMSDRKKYEQQLEQTNAELLRATRLKDEFLAAMSHELRTPLNAILGMTEGLQEEVFGIVNERQLKALQIVERSGCHLLELINDILDMAKIEAGQVELSYSSTAIALLAQSSITFVNQQAHKKHIQIEMQIAPNLPDISLDERRICQVLINLLNNAVKFTPEGGQIKLEVDRRGEQSSPNDRAWLRFSITDTGIGIAPENIPKLFQPFIQIDSALSRKYGGTGLGLALVKQIVDLHGGRVSLTSELGVGSCFVVEIPYNIIVLTPSESQTQINLNVEIDKPEQTRSPLILIAEDNESNINTINDYLEAKGYRLLIARDGIEAIALTKAHHPDIILMDIQMPVMDGIEAIQQIRLDPNLADIPIIALTALAMTGDRDRCFAAGANEYLSKPVKLKELVATIQKML